MFANLPFYKSNRITELTKVANLTKASLKVHCSQCNSDFKVQANLTEGVSLDEGHIPFPKNNLFHCPTCGLEQDLSNVKRQIEARTKKPLVFEQNHDG